MTNTTTKTASIRVSVGLEEMVREIALLNRCTSAAVCERLFRRALTKELEAARKREMERLATVASK
jgi:hypothetical protein